MGQVIYNWPAFAAGILEIHIRKSHKQKHVLCPPKILHHKINAFPPGNGEKNTYFMWYPVSKILQILSIFIPPGLDTCSHVLHKVQNLQEYALFPVLV